ncbi:LOW QUALITY PROTEIN: hypothetical protein QC763_310780 [Podospora pseudopauciseta]|uniref:Uncharacterized protein n=1 Tax=Podospora pseudopauciseta TaxID=2093780 RepID=A0ABR0HI94_9PEZI|nr:LOW QUALITY PROTEIN: hypothetical protein QC763_310780 [Podospora pseudopauciseta]
MLSVWHATGLPPASISLVVVRKPIPLEQPARPDIPFSKTPQHFPETNINNNNPEHWIQLPESMNWSGEKAPVLSSLPNLPTRLLQQPLPTYLRYVHRTDAFTALIFIAGTCLDRRTPDPKAGWALVHARAPDYPKLSLLAWKGRGLLATMAPRPATGRSFALPLPPCVLNSDPTKKVSAHLSSLSIPSMWLRALPHEPKLGSKSNGKRARGRTLRTGIYGRHCWVRLKKAKERNMAVQFWKVSKEWNVDAHDAAMKATEQPAADSFQDQI